MVIADNPYDAPDSPDTSEFVSLSSLDKLLISWNLFRLDMLAFINRIIKLLQLLRWSTKSRSKGLQAIWLRIVVGTSIVPEYHKESVNFRLASATSEGNGGD